MRVPSEGKVDRHLPERGPSEREYSVIEGDLRSFCLF